MGRIFAILIVLLMLVGGTAHADGPQDTPRTVGDLLQAYGIEGSPADYVVVVDTSSSMMGPPALYPPVVEAYKKFVSAIGDNDQLSVITFDATPNLRLSGDLSTQVKREAAANALPSASDGQATDIGAALSATLDRLERPGSSEVETVVFLTDGQIDAPSSPYWSTSSGAWSALADRARAVVAGHRLSVYGAGLGGGATDVAALKIVFPATQIVSLPPDQLTDFFNEAIQRARVERLYTPVTNELREGFVAVDVTPRRLGDVTTLDIRLRSHLPHLGAKVIVKSVSVTADGKPARAQLIGGPRTIDIAPDDASEPIEVDVDQSLPGGRRFGAQTQRVQFGVNLDADVIAIPQEVIAKSLGITSTPRLVQSDLVTAQRTVGIAYWLLAVAVGCLLLLAALASWIHRRYVRVPLLPGGVVVLADGTSQPFRGKVMDLPNKDVGLNATDGSIVRFFTKRGRFRGGKPQIYVRKIQGLGQVEKLGVPRPLNGGEQPVMPTDVVVVGRARLRLTSGRSGSGGSE